jgi:hypothetical protein
MALDEFDCGLEEHPPGRSGWVDLFTSFVTQDTWAEDWEKLGDCAFIRDDYIEVIPRVMKGNYL